MELAVAVGTNHERRDRLCTRGFRNQPQLERPRAAWYRQFLSGNHHAEGGVPRDVKSGQAGFCGWHFNSFRFWIGEDQSFAARVREFLRGPFLKLGLFVERGLRLADSLAG